MVGEALANDGTVTVFGAATVGGIDVTPAQRALLAALALAGDAGAGIDELADAVWSGRPPRSARASLQNQMSRLRRAHGDDLVVCEQTRYRLGPPTDVGRFESLLRRADEATTASDEQLGYLETALSLWRDTPYDDLDCHRADVERRRLEERRAATVERLTLARFERGRADAAVADLRVELERDPYRDRTWELLVIALHRAGRRGEALAAVDEHVRRRREEFDASPAPRMIELAAMLRSPQVDLRSGADAHRPRSARRCRIRPHRGSHRQH